MAEVAKLELDGKIYEFPVIEGSENEKAIDISTLRSTTGYITIDPGFKNTGSTKSGITFLNGEEGILRYRGYPIEQLAAKAEFLEVAYLLIYDNLPTTDEYAAFKENITKHTLVHEDMRLFFEAYPAKAHPMGILAASLSTLSTFYPESQDPNRPQEAVDLTIHRLIAKVPTLAAWAFKNAMRHPVIYPNNQLDYCENFLNMMFSMPTGEYKVDPVVAMALNKLLILHADHEQNCSTATVRVVGSSQANLYTSIAAGVSALWGPLHGGANQAVIEMLEAIKEDGGNVDKWIDKAKDKDDSFRLMGFGHRVYKNFDPRATIIKKAADEVLDALGVDDPVLDIARKLEKVALNDEYFKSRGLYPNVDFYSGIIYRALGIPTEMFTVMFALGRLPGWIAQWKEMIEDGAPIGRPRQIYTGETDRDFVEIADR
ncbi:MAG: citrate (Si)-synthase [Flavobacteriales bacterium]|nr:MAG: citrate (Si)-synthase [Flavobacteriales bacterium]